MRNFRNKTFPWPVLRPGVDDYVRGEFRSDIDLRVTEDASSVTLTVDFKIEGNDELLDLLEGSRAQYCVAVSSPRTFYREAFLTRDRQLRQEFKRGILSERVAISPFLVACSQMEGLTNPSFNEEYEHSKFDLDAGSVLALGAPKTYYVDTTLFKHLGSVFRLDTREKVQDGNFEYQIHGSEFITIYMSSEDCARFEAIRARGNVVAMKKFFAGVYLPVLTAVLYDLDKDSGEYRDLRWARALENKLNELGLRPPGNGESRLEDAQRILQSPFRGILDLED